MAFVLEALRGDEALDPWGLGVWLGALFLRLDFAANDIFADLVCHRQSKQQLLPREDAHIILFRQPKHLPDPPRALRAQPLRLDGIRVSETRDLRRALLDNGKGKHGEVHGDDAAANGLAAALTGAAGAVARVAGGEKEPHARRVHDALLHWETLLVVAAGDLEDVAFPLVAEDVALDFLTHALVHDCA